MKETASFVLVLSLELLLVAYQYTSTAKLNHIVQVQNNFCYIKCLLYGTLFEIKFTSVMRTVFSIIYQFLLHDLF